MEAKLNYVERLLRLTPLIVPTIEKDKNEKKMKEKENCTSLEKLV